MVERSRVFAVAGFVCSGLAAAFLVASFASPYWVESNPDVTPTGFVRMGLWEICFHNYYPINRPATKRRYEGCWAAISYEMEALYSYFFPPWLRTVQVLCTLATVQSVACVVINIIYFIHCCPSRLEFYSVLISAIISFVSALFLFISATMFGVHVDTDRNWLKERHSVYLSWAFGFTILGAILCLASGMCLTTDFLRLRIERGMYDRQDEASPRRNARYSAPPPQYDLAVKAYSRPQDAAPPAHHNAGYSPPRPDAWHDGRKPHSRNSTSAASHGAGGQYSDPESETYEDSRPRGDRPSTRGHQNARYSESLDDKTRSYDRRSSAGRSQPDGRYSSSQPDGEGPRPYSDRRSDTDRPSRRGRERRSESQPPQSREDTRSLDRHTERSSRHAAHRSEPHSDHSDEARSTDRYSSSQPARQKTRHSQSRSRDEDTRSSGRRADTTPPSSRRSAKNSEYQSGGEDGKLYDRRSSGSRPPRHSARRAEALPRHEATRQRY